MATITLVTQCCNKGQHQAAQLARQYPGCHLVVRHLHGRSPAQLGLTLPPDFPSVPTTPVVLLDQDGRLSWQAL